MAVSIEGSLYVSSLLLSDLYDQIEDHNIYCAIGNVGKPRASLLVPYQGYGNSNLSSNTSSIIIAIPSKPKTHLNRHRSIPGSQNIEYSILPNTEEHETCRHFFGKQ